MDLSKILSVTGKSGLFKLLSHNKTSFIVESLTDGKRFPVFPNDGVATLDNISIFTEDDDVSLQSVLLSIYKKENGAQSAVNVSDNNALKAYFAEILPNYDRERVYVSNMKKVILWYNQLVEKQLIDDKEEEKTEN
ncbi:MAG: DUF5606 domain-containing protein [Bacteroidales bacterium]|nr:hypothetical protein [Bacteroidota bacterium]MBR6063709.1 DUF5606 domain-containing protein [Bacteroidales bacterium]